MESELAGGCLCGAVRYRVAGLAVASGICHCRSCRKTASAPALPFATYPAAAFEITKGVLAEFRSSADVTRGFCRDCSAPLTYRHAENPDKLDIMTCSLDDVDALPPTFHVWASHKPAWSVLDDGLPVFDTTRSASKIP
jgi:hypothetical protein